MRGSFSSSVKLSFWYLLVLYVNCSVKRLKFAPKRSISYFQPILAAIFDTIATVKVKLISDLVYKLKKIVGSNNFSAQFIKIISHYKKIGYNINVLQQTACLVVNPITVGNFAFLFNCTPVGRTSDSMMVPT